MATDAGNRLISTKPSEAPLSVSLHPLVLLTASDLITRHRVRNEQGPFAGILLGQQDGRATTAEHAFPAKLRPLDSEGWDLHEAWLETRIQQFKDVHKAPALDVVGWFTTCPDSGPLPEHARIQKQINGINDNAIFLAIHPAALNSSDTTNRKLPITIYETIVEGEPMVGDEDMQVDGEDGTKLKFREMAYSIDTDETEMIAIDYVAKGAGSAAAIQGAGQAEPSSASGEIKGKQRADGKVEKKVKAYIFRADELTTEEEDQIAGITTRLNSIKMLQSRLQVLSKYVQSLPPSYISDPSVPLTIDAPDKQHLSHLRNIQALLTRLTLLTPPETQDGGGNMIRHAAQSQKNDVALTTMLAQLGADVRGLEELGKKFATVETAKGLKNKGKGGYGSNTLGGADDHDGKVGGFSISDGLLV